MTTSNSPKIIGLAGTFGSGKDTLAQYLVDHYNFLHVSTSDMVRQEAMKRFGSIERPVLHEVANALRAEKGPGVLVLMARALFMTKRQAENYQGVVISGIRSIGEAEAILTAKGVIVFVDAPVEVRYQRMADRRRDSEASLTLEEFKAGEDAELAAANPTDKTVQNMNAIRQMASVQLMNNRDRDTFIAAAVKALSL